MKKPDPILVADRFAPLRSRLREVLVTLDGAGWSAPTTAGSWTVQDVAAHLLSGDIGILSRRRDEFYGAGGPIHNHRELIELVNRLNAEWVTAARRMSPRVLIDVLDFTGPQVEAYFGALDLFALGEPVTWAGSDPAPVWMDVAREFTERWHHQQQIRDAVGREPLYEPYYLQPVLDAFMRAVPASYVGAIAPDRSSVRIRITGESGGRWDVIRIAQSWALYLDSGLRPEAEIAISQDIAWRLFTKGLSGEQALGKSTVIGNPVLAQPFFGTIAVIG